MKIHHNIIRSVKNNGAEINEYDGKFVLVHNEMGLRAVSDDAKFLRQLAADWAKRENIEDYYVEDQMTFEESDEDADEDSEAMLVAKGTKKATGGASPSDEDYEDEDEYAPHSVVKGDYKERYRERGDANSCGDWFAQAMKTLTHDEDGKFVMNWFTALAELNGIDDWRKYITSNPNSVGLMRMSVGNRLRTIVKKTGKLNTPAGALAFNVD